MLQIKYTKQAEIDLDTIFHNIFKDKPSVAVEYVNKMREFIRLLQLNPYLGFDCKKKNIKKDCRILVFGSYNIYYNITKKSIKIGKIKNSRQNKI